MDALNIGELADKAGLRTSAIRFYESVGLLPKPARRSGWRRYDPSVRDRLQVIHAAREVGISIADIRTLLDGFPKGESPSRRWKNLAKRKLPDLEATIQRTMALKYLIEAGIECDCDEIALRGGNGSVRWATLQRPRPPNNSIEPTGQPGVWL